jgi:hypothetical protein
MVRIHARQITESQVLAHAQSKSKIASLDTFKKHSLFRPGAGFGGQFRSDETLPSFRRRRLRHPHAFLAAFAAAIFRVASAIVPTGNSILTTPPIPSRWPARSIFFAPHENRFGLREASLAI